MSHECMATECTSGVANGRSVTYNCCAMRMALVSTCVSLCLESCGNGDLVEHVEEETVTRRYKYNFATMEQTRLDVENGRITSLLPKRLGPSYRTSWGPVGVALSCLLIAIANCISDLIV